MIFMKDYIKEICDILQKIKKYGLYTVVFDYVEIIAIICKKASMFVLCCSNDLIKKEEDRYLQIASKYDKEHLEVFAEAYAKLLEAIVYYSDKGVYKDIIGHICEYLGILDKHKQQFFTPENISKFMANAMLTPIDVKELANNRFITLCDPCSGCGRLMLGAVEVAKREKIDVSADILVFAKDVDRLMAMASFVQLNHYAVPAVVEWGDSLTNSVNERFITLTCALQWFKFRSFFEQKNKTEEAAPVINDPDTVYEDVQSLSYGMDMTQPSLF